MGRLCRPFSVGKSNVFETGVLCCLLSDWFFRAADPGAQTVELFETFLQPPSE